MRHKIALVIFLLSTQVIADISGPSLQMLLAARAGNIRALRKALAEGANIEARDRYVENGLTAIHLALLIPDEERARLCLQELFQAGLELDFYNLDGFSPLHWVIATRNMPALELLMELGADLEEISESGRTPFMFAAEIGHQEAVLRLGRAGARTELTDDDGRRAADLAYFAGHLELAWTLRNGAFIPDRTPDTTIDPASVFHRGPAAPPPPSVMPAPSLATLGRLLALAAITGFTPSHLRR